MPNAHFERDFIMEFRSAGGSGKKLDEFFGSKIPEIQIDTETNRRFTVVTSRIKASFVQTKVIDAGTGKLTFEGHHYTMFREELAR